MNTHDLSLVHLVREPQANVDQPPLLILLHGVGGDEHGFNKYPIAHEITAETLRAVNQWLGARFENTKSV